MTLQRVDIYGKNNVGFPLDEKFGRTYQRLTKMCKEFKYKHPFDVKIRVKKSA